MKRTEAPVCPDCGKRNHVARWGIAHGYQEADYSCLRCVVESAREALRLAFAVDRLKEPGYWERFEGGTT